jgi:hypothetical protein
MMHVCLNVREVTKQDNATSNSLLHKKTLPIFGPFCCASKLSLMIEMIPWNETSSLGSRSNPQKVCGGNISRTVKTIWFEVVDELREEGG